MPFTPIDPADGYLPIEDHGLIGDGSTAALVARDGAIDWLCVPRFDSQPLFCRILDHERGGAFVVAPERIVEARQYYEEDTGIVVTEMRGPNGLVRVTDALTLRAGTDLTEEVAHGRRELLRSVEVLEGTVRLRVAVEPRGGAEAERRGGGLQVRCHAQPDLSLQLYSTLPLDGLWTTFDLSAGDHVSLSLWWQKSVRMHHPTPPSEILANTREAWRRWARLIEYDGPRKSMVHRSTITLKLLDDFETGAIVAAPTSSLPEAIGGPRNWDYRYAWIRDAAFSVYALRRVGIASEAEGFLAWVLDAAERHGAPRVLYAVDGAIPPREREDPDLEGYRRSQPVRWGNGAADQQQNDVYGEIIDCAYQWAAHGGQISEALWAQLRVLVDAAAAKWHQSDQGIWEVRTHGRVFTYSAAMCHVALDRGLKIAERFGLPAPLDRWRQERDRIQQAILHEAWNADLNSFTESLGGASLDASLLALPLRRVIRADDPRMVSTTRAVRERLSAGDGLLYRYLPDESPDGLAGHEGAFLLCSFWLVENWARQGRLDEAEELFESLCARSNPLGLLPEQIDPASGAFLGNFPQGFSHIGVISGAIALARARAKRRRLSG